MWKYWNWKLYVVRDEGYKDYVIWDEDYIDGTIITKTYIRASNIWEAMEVLQAKREAWEKMGKIVKIEAPEEWNVDVFE